MHARSVSGVRRLLKAAGELYIFNTFVAVVPLEDDYP